MADKTDSSYKIDEDKLIQYEKPLLEVVANLSGINFVSFDSLFRKCTTEEGEKVIHFLCVYFEDGTHLIVKVYTVALKLNDNQRIFPQAGHIIVSVAQDEDEHFTVIPKLEGYGEFLKEINESTGKDGINSRLRTVKCEVVDKQEADS